VGRSSITTVSTISNHALHIGRDS